MTFRIALNVDGLHSLLRDGRFEIDPCDSEDDVHIITVLKTQCEALATFPCVRLEVSGFGDDHWRVDIPTDLAIAIEQLPEVFTGLRESRSFEFNFFEQGVERWIAARHENDRIRFECTSLHPRWTPNPNVEFLPIADARAMFEALRDTYRAAVETVCPWLTTSAAFKAWDASSRSELQFASFGSTAGGDGVGSA